MRVYCIVENQMVAFDSMKEAMTRLKCSRYVLRTKYQMRRRYEHGYWNGIPSDYFKALSVKKYAFVDA